MVQTDVVTQRAQMRQIVLDQCFGLKEMVEAIEANVAVGNYATAALCLDDLVAAAKLARRGIKSLED